MEAIKLNGFIYPFALECVVGYRGVSINKLCKDCDVHKSDLLYFFKGHFAIISEEKLREIMIYLDWPFDFLCQNIKPIKTSMSL